MHTVRIFGNWMSHADYQHYDERDKRPLKVTHYHLNAMLLALHCVVTETWKKKEQQPPVKLPRSVGEELPKPRSAGGASDGAAAGRLRQQPGSLNPSSFAPQPRKRSSRP